ncbi:MAG: DUF3866 family protein [Actinomycetota bacterium]|nr:DUF3866 family protein [Actinomycetota bacterium]
MIRLRRGRVIEVVEERPGATQVRVEVEGTEASAIVYPAMVGPVEPGASVLLNTTAVDLGLGTGGVHFVIAVENGPELDPLATGRTMKLRYTPQQVKVLTAEEEDSVHRSVMVRAEDLKGTPVVWVPLHSLLAPVAAGAKAAGAKRVAYVMTDGAALPAPLSRLLAALRSAALVDAVITTGQAFGGDLETVNVFTGLLAAHAVADSDVIVVGDGPGNMGTNTTWGATDVESAMALNAAAILGGRPVAALRVSFADPRERHRGVSHHALTALSRVVLAPAHVAVPAMADERERSMIWKGLKEARLEERHQLVEATGQPALNLLRDRGIDVESMGRAVEDDPEFFLAGGAAGVLAGRMAKGRWRRGQ